MSHNLSQNLMKLITEELFDAKGLLGTNFIINYSHLRIDPITDFVYMQEDKWIKMLKDKPLVKNMKLLILYMPIVFTSVKHVTELLRLLAHIEWVGKIAMIDIKSDVTRDFIRKMPLCPSLLIGDGLPYGGDEPGEDQLFCITWDKVAFKSSPVTDEIKISNTYDYKPIL